MSSQCPSDTAGVLPPSSRRCPVLRRSARPASAPQQVVPLEHPLPYAGSSRSAGHSPRQRRGRLGPLAQSRRLHRLRPDQQYPYPGKSAFLVRPASCSSSSPTRRSALPGVTAPVLWPRLTPAASTRPRDRGYHLRRPRQQVSPGKNVDFPCTLAPFTAPTLDCIGLRCLLPTRPIARPRMGFVFLKSQVCLRLPPDPTSR